MFLSKDNLQSPNRQTQSVKNIKIYTKLSPDTSPIRESSELLAETNRKDVLTQRSISFRTRVLNLVNPPRSAYTLNKWETPAFMGILDLIFAFSYLGPLLGREAARNGPNVFQVLIVDCFFGEFWGYFS